jgi:hypothetical protein
VLKELLSCKMKVGTPVREHVLKMYGHISELQRLGMKIDDETLTDIILQSLPGDFTKLTSSSYSTWER